MLSGFLKLVLAGGIGMTAAACVDDGNPPPRNYYPAGPTYYQPATYYTPAPQYHRHRRDRDGDGIPDRYDRDKNGDGVPDKYQRRWR